MEISQNEMNDWALGRKLPFRLSNPKTTERTAAVERVDLNGIHSTKEAATKRERVLILTPLRDASPYLSTHFKLLSKLTYPHDLIDLAFLVSDSKDDTRTKLAVELEKVQSNSNPSIPFRSATIVEKDFGVTLSQEVHDRHGFAAQGPRRKAIGRARNYLLSTALKADHSWVFWWDVDVVETPARVIEDFIAHDKDILVPSMLLFTRFPFCYDTLTFFFLCEKNSTCGMNLPF